MFNLVNKIKRDWEKLEETTTGGDIAYLPSQLGTISPYMQTLSKIKKTWKLTFLENIDETIVNFEDHLKIKVKNSDMQDFLENALHLKTLPLDSMVNLTQHLKEAFDDDLNQSYIRLKEALLDMISTQPFVSADLNFEDWKSKFGGRGYSSPKEVLLKFETFKLDVDKLINKLKEVIKDDKGQIDMITSTIESRGSLNVYPIFKDYKYLVGSIINSEFYGVNLIYSVMVSMAYQIQENVEIVNDDDLLGEVGAYRGLKVVGRQLVPVGGTFTQRFFQFLADNIVDRA